MSNNNTPFPHETGHVLHAVGHYDSFISDNSTSRSVPWARQDATYGHLFRHRLSTSFLTLILICPFLVAALPASLSLCAKTSPSSCIISQHSITNISDVNSNTSLANAFEVSSHNGIICEDGQYTRPVSVPDCLELFAAMHLDNGARTRTWEPPAIHEYKRGKCIIQWATTGPFTGVFSYNTLVYLATQILEHCEGTGGIPKPASKGGNIDMGGVGGLGWFAGVSGLDGLPP